jgi:hypothetical protein
MFVCWLVLSWHYEWGKQLADVKGKTLPPSSVYIEGD